MASTEFKAFYQKILSKPINPHQKIQEIRENFEKLLSEYPPEPDVQFEDFTIKHIPAMKCSVRGQDKKGAILFFHGGAYNVGSNYSHRDLMGRISKASHFPVIGIDYRLAPEHPYPAALEDAIDAYQYLLKSYKPSEIVLAGSSAGGGLAVSLLLHLKNEKLALPAGAVCICPWVDLAMTGSTIQSNEGKDILTKARLESSVKFYCGSHNKKDPFISPLLWGFIQSSPSFDSNWRAGVAAR